MIWIVAPITIAASGILWHMGGQGKKWARAWGVGAVVALGKALLLWSVLSVWALVYIPILYLMICCFSYGLSAPVHKFWVMVFGSGDDGSNPAVEIATRATCGFGWSLAGITFALVTGQWAIQALYTIACALLCVFFGLQKEVKLSEIGTGCSVALAIFV